jgi:cyclophilin family peptidyl-prolyl cis-trans isomerase
MTDRRQRQKEQRTARREQERRRAARKELRRRLTFAGGIGIAVAAVFLITSVLGNRPREQPAAYRQFLAKPTACDATPPAEEELMSFDAPGDEGLDPEVPVIASLNTSCGPLTIELEVATAPQTANSFVFLARQGFYDGTVLHRIISDFVIQGGDPEADGRGGPGYRLPDEYPPEGFVYDQGAVAMANAGAGTTGSQFFVVVGEDARRLRPIYNLLGQVVDGFETLEAIAAVPTALRPGSSEQSLPLQSVYIESIEITLGE